jgi:pentatricopeptide repeat protein
MLATSIILTTPTCKLLIPAFIMEEWMDEGDEMIQEMIERKMVSAETFSAHFPIPTFKA